MGLCFLVKLLHHFAWITLRAILTPAGTSLKHLCGPSRMLLCISSSCFLEILHYLKCRHYYFRFDNASVISKCSSLHHGNPLQFKFQTCNCHQDAGMNHSACMSSGTTSRKTFKRNSSAISVRQNASKWKKWDDILQSQLNQDWRLTLLQSLAKAQSVLAGVCLAQCPPAPFCSTSYSAWHTSRTLFQGASFQCIPSFLSGKASLK